MLYLRLSKIIRAVLFFLATWLASSAVSAQSVYKCVDASGLVTFSDSACSAAEHVTGSLHEIRPNSTVKSDLPPKPQYKPMSSYSSELGANSNSRNDKRAIPSRGTTQPAKEDGYERKLQFQKEQLTREQRQRPAEYLRSWVAQSIDCLPRDRKGLMAAQDIVTEWYRSSNAKKIREVVFKNGAGCAGPAPELPKRSTPPSTPSIITSCDAGGCLDNLGGRYNKGAGNTYIPSTGGACQIVGGMMHCP